MRKDWEYVNRLIAACVFLLSAAVLVSALVMDARTNDLDKRVTHLEQTR